MNVLLINPRTDDMIGTELPSYIAKEVGRFPPLGLLYLAAAVRAGGRHAVRVVDMPATDTSYAELARELRRTAPDLVGVTGTTHNLVDILRTARCVKEAAPGLPVCLGGPHADAYPREAAAEPDIDYVLRGEAERSFVRLLDALQDGTPCEDIPGLACVRGGRTRLNAPDASNGELDGLPFPARDLVRTDDYFYVLGKRATITTLLSSRGCPYRCTFCSTPRGRYRVRSPENIVAEMEACVAGGAREIHFVDDTFNAQRGRLRRVSRCLLDRGLPVAWSFRGRADTLEEGELELAAQAGCVRMNLGVETGSDRGLERLRKGITTADVERALRWARRAGVTTAAYFMIGCPHEAKREDVLRTIDFACRAGPDFALFNILAIYPHTELHRQAEEKGLIDPSRWPAFVRAPRADFELPFWEEFFDRGELSALLETAYRRFYLRPSMIWRNLAALRSVGELKHKAAAGLSILTGGKA